MTEGVERRLEAIHITLKELLAVMKARGPKMPTPTEKEAIAALLVVGPHMTQIARRLGIHRGTLYRMKEFMKFYKKASTPSGTPRRGFKTDTGLEAMSDS